LSFPQSAGDFQKIVLFFILFLWMQKLPAAYHPLTMDVDKNDSLWERLSRREKQTENIALKIIADETIAKQIQEKNDNSSMWKSICDNEQKCLLFIGFTPQEFLQLYQLVEPSLIVE
jgi:hypothetical protein